MASHAVNKILIDQLSECNDDIVEEVIEMSRTTLDRLSVYSEVLINNPKDTNPDAHVEHFAEIVVPRYTDYQFKSHFRMYPEVFEALCEWIGPDLPERSVPVSKKLLSTIWLLSTPESYRSMADRFGFNKGALHRIVMATCHALVAKRGDVICWLRAEELRELAAQWQERAGLRGVVGAVDGTFIQIPGTTDEHRDAWICRKGYPAMQLQVVCDKNLKFLDISTGSPGSVHDARVFRNSDLKTFLEADEGRLPPQYYLLGDSAYPLTDYLLPPYRDNGHLSVAQKRYNQAHSSTRVEVERAIGLLKGKFKRLKFLDMIQGLDIPYVIFAACVLHNFILIHKGIDEEDIELSDDDDDDEVNNEDAPARSGEEKRLAVTQSLA